MGVKFEVTQNLFGEALAQIDAGAARATERTAKRIAERARRAIKSPPKSGRIYRSKTKPSPHQASAPGQAPADWTGALHDSIEPVRVGRHEWEVRAGTPYAGRLEFGGAKIAPRPFLAPATEAEREAYLEELGDALK